LESRLAILVAEHKARRSYGIVFGSGAFGAEAFGGLGDGNNSVGSPNFFTYFQFDADAWEGA
jgi:hypothetical protein